MTLIVLMTLILRITLILRMRVISIMRVIDVMRVIDIMMGVTSPSHERPERRPWAGSILGQWIHSVKGPLYTPLRYRSFSAYIGVRDDIVFQSHEWTIISNSDIIGMGSTFN